MEIDLIRRPKQEERTKPGRLFVVISEQHVGLSADLKRALQSEPDQPVQALFGVAEDGRLAVKKATRARLDAWTFNAKTGRSGNKQLLNSLREKGVAAGRYSMEWDERERWFLSTGREEYPTRRRRG